MGMRVAATATGLRWGGGDRGGTEMGVVVAVVTGLKWRCCGGCDRYEIGCLWLRWFHDGCGGGGRDGIDMEVMWGCGGEVLTLRCWIWRSQYVDGSVCDWLGVVAATYL
jgi:hypothetical protein